MSACEFILQSSNMIENIHETIKWKDKLPKPKKQYDVNENSIKLINSTYVEMFCIDCHKKAKEVCRFIEEIFELHIVANFRCKNSPKKMSSCVRPQY